VAVVLVSPRPPLHHPAPCGPRGACTTKSRLDRGLRTLWDGLLVVRRSQYQRQAPEIPMRRSATYRTPIHVARTTSRPISTSERGTRRSAGPRCSRRATWLAWMMSASATPTPIATRRLPRVPARSPTPIAMRSAAAPANIVDTSVASRSSATALPADGATTNSPATSPTVFRLIATDRSPAPIRTDLTRPLDCSCASTALRPKRGAQVVDAGPMAACADGKAASERDGVVRPVEGLVEEPATARQSTARAQLPHHRVPHGWLIRTTEIQLLHHRRALAERDSSGTEILGQHGAVPGANVGTVRAHGGVWLWLWREGGLIGASVVRGRQSGL